MNSTYRGLKQVNSVPEYNVLQFDFPSLILGKIQLEYQLPEGKLNKRLSAGL